MIFSRISVFSAAAAGIATAALALTPVAATASPATAQPGPTPSDPVITATGLTGVTVGQQRTELAQEQGLRQGPGDCAPRLPAYPQASPVFAGDRLVLLWADPPLKTPDGLAVGSPVADVRTAHPDAQQLTAEPGTYRFDGLLAPTGGGEAYLFLHDGESVQKVIVGSEPHARLLFDEGFGAC